LSVGSRVEADFYSRVVPIDPATRMPIMDLAAANELIEMFGQAIHSEHSILDRKLQHCHFYTSHFSVTQFDQYARELARNNTFAWTQKKRGPEKACGCLVVAKHMVWVRSLFKVCCI
jgi:hypothetical protein